MRKKTVDTLILALLGAGMIAASVMMHFGAYVGTIGAAACLGCALGMYAYCLKSSYLHMGHGCVLLAHGLSGLLLQGSLWEMEKPAFAAGLLTMLLLGTLLCCLWLGLKSRRKLKGWYAEFLLLTFLFSLPYGMRLNRALDFSEGSLVEATVSSTSPIIRKNRGTGQNVTFELENGGRFRFEVSQYTPLTHGQKVTLELYEGFFGYPYGRMHASDDTQER